MTLHLEKPLVILLSFELWKTRLSSAVVCKRLSMPNPKRNSSMAAFATSSLRISTNEENQKFLHGNLIALNTGEGEFEGLRLGCKLCVLD